MVTNNRTLEEKLKHMARFVGIPTTEQIDSLWYKEEWRPHEKWDQLMRVYEKVSQWVRTSDGKIDRDEHLTYISKFEVGTNQIFISLWTIQPNNEFGYTNIYHAYVPNSEKVSDCDSVKEMFFESLSDFIKVVQYTEDLYGHEG